MNLRKTFKFVVLLIAVLNSYSSSEAQTISVEIELDDAYSQVRKARLAVETPSEMADVIASYQALADQGHALSAYRLARIYRFAILVEKDLGKAVEYYQKSVELGRAESLGELGIALLYAGRSEEAYAAFEKADEAGVTGSHELARARANVRGDFGDISDQQDGMAELEALWADGDQRAGSTLAQAHYYGWSGQVDHEKSLAIFRQLADQGDAYALDRIAVFYRYGYVVERDYAQAMNYYQQAVDAGREKSMFGLADVQVRLNRGSAALRTLQKASEAGLEDAGLEIAVGHINRDFGYSTDVQKGVSALLSGIEEDKIDYKIAAVELLAEGRRFSTDVPALVAALEAEADQGNASAAGALIQLTREKPGLVENAWRKRQDYLEAYSEILSDRTRATETVYLTLDSKRPREVGPALSDLLAGYQDDAFRYGFQRVFWEDKNAYTYLLQEKLKDLGLYKGNVNGLMTKNTVRAVLSFCRRVEIYDECIHGPMRSGAMRKIVDALVPAGA
ncbi:TPR repeat [Thalassococcus halodurans]|uniref:TPR repeat n=1 Tax=Thalassococcus halodurans TaxID=373675 RepID=A0A1H6BWV3_9RHOB|nr:tetratricopeptide repeat protein [Thalassococcus halodurans]SEG64935.1 TPR repeat [Thalassococcus halodurans]